MKISLNWLKKFIEISENPEDLESILTEVGLEVDEVISLEPDKDFLSKLIVGEITEIEKHPNADRLNITKVDTGKESLSIICGANNIEVRQKVVVAKSGTKIKNTEKYDEWIEYIEDRPFNDKRYSISSKKIKNLGWKPERNLLEDLPSIIEWYNKNYNLFK